MNERTTMIYKSGPFYGVFRHHRWLYRLGFRWKERMQLVEGYVAPWADDVPQWAQSPTAGIVGTWQPIARRFSWRWIPLTPWLRVAPSPFFGGAAMTEERDVLSADDVAEIADYIPRELGLPLPGLLKIAASHESLRACLDETRRERDEARGELVEFVNRTTGLETTVRRVWAALGDPPYESLDGATIAEVVASRVARAVAAEAEVAETRRERDEARELLDEVQDAYFDGPMEMGEKMDAVCGRIACFTGEVIRLVVPPESAPVSTPNSQKEEPA